MRIVREYLIFIFALPFLLTSGSIRAENAPVVDFESIMNSYFDDTSGLMAFRDFRIAFAPDPPFNGVVAVLDPDGEIVGSHAFYPDYVNKEGVFATIRAQNPADVTVTTPGIYTIVFVINNKPATRFPVRLEQTSAGEDAFNPEKTYRFDGYWRIMANIRMGTWKDEPFPLITMWIGGMDLAEGETKDTYLATLIRDGETVAHSKQIQSHVAPGHFEPKYVNLYHPHTEKEVPNAKPFMLKDWQVNGSYELRVTRGFDDKMIRSFDFDVVDGKIQGLERSKLGYDPVTDYVMPRIVKRNATSLEMIEAIWIEDRRKK